MKGTANRLTNDFLIYFFEETKTFINHLLFVVFFIIQKEDHKI